MLALNRQKKKTNKTAVAAVIFAAFLLLSFFYPPARDIFSGLIFRIASPFVSAGQGVKD